MKKKIMLSFIITIVFSLVLLTSSFITISNYQYINSSKENLKHYNDVLSVAIDNNYSDDKLIFILEKLKIKDQFIRFTLIDPNGKVKFDSDFKNEKFKNHNEREEIIFANKNGEGSSTRYSESLNINMIYYATKLSDGFIIRSAIPAENVKIFENQNIKFYVITLIFVIILAIFISQKLTRIIVNPLKELEFITSKMAKGKLSKRVRINSNDELGSLGKTFNDMADRLQNTLEELIDKQNRLEAILRSMDSGVIAIDRNHKLIMINPYAKKIFGIKKDVIGQNLLENIRDFEFDSVFENPNEYKEIKIIWPKERNLRIKTAEIINKGQHIGTVAVVQDITDIKRLENMRSRFVANVSHELKTPITSIKGFAETLRYVNDEKLKTKFLDIIDDETERLSRLINDILTLSNIEQKKDKFYEKVYPNDIIENVCTLIKIEADNKNIKITKSLNSTNILFGDKDKFKQMMINLIDNAIKYSEPNAEINVITENIDEFVKITVKDTGIGIPKNDIPRLFERFYRVDKDRSRAKGGTGLGLAIVKYIVKRFKGDITVESELGVGSTFTIILKRIKK